MGPFLRRLSRNIPTFLLAFIMACAVWVTAVSSSDPNQTKNYPNVVPVTVFGQGPGLILTDASTDQVVVSLLAPQSIWSQMNQGIGVVKAVADITGLGPGTHTVPIKVSVSDVKPVDIIKVEPATLTVTLEAQETRTLPLTLTINGTPATGFKLGISSYSPDYISISGPQSIVQQVYKVIATLNVNQAQADIHQTITIKPVDINDDAIAGLTLSPSQITVSLPVTQLGGYRNVAVKVITKGQISSGYRITNISVFPLVVTVFSSDPTLVDSIPGVVETNPIDLTGAHDDIDTQASLNLPEGVSVVCNQSNTSATCNQTVTVQVGIAAIEGSITLSNMPIKVINLGPDLAGDASPNTVDVILSGPLNQLDQITSDQVHVTIDMSGKEAGTYQATPNVSVDVPNITVESILPQTIQVTIISATPTPAGTTSPGVIVGTPGTPALTGTPPRKTPTPTPTP